MVAHTCRYCGSTTEIPAYFSLARQRLFEYIWKHPGCTIADMCRDVYGTNMACTVISVHLAHIRKGLLSFREYTLTMTTTKSTKPRTGRQPRRFFIKPSVRTEKTGEQPTEGISNGPV
jgi:hypothetical protein